MIQFVAWAREVVEVADTWGHQRVVPSPEIPQESKSQDPSSLAILPVSDNTTENCISTED